MSKQTGHSKIDTMQKELLKLLIQSEIWIISSCLQSDPVHFNGFIANACLQSRILFAKLRFSKKLLDLAGAHAFKTLKWPTMT